MFTRHLLILPESPCTFFEEITQATYDDRWCEITVKLAVSTCAETIEEKQEFVSFQVIKLGGDYLCCFGKLVSVGLSLQSFKVAKLVKLWHKPRLRRCIAITDVQLG